MLNGRVITGPAYDALLDNLLLVQEVMARLAKEEGGSRATGSKLNNMIMQMRKNCNHPDLISSAFSNEVRRPHI